jgi:cytochrome c2
MDSNEVNKLAGAAIASLLVFVLLGFFSGQLYHGGGGGHGDEHTLAFALPIEEETATADAGVEEETIDLASLVASADPAAGESIYRQCRACHKIEDGANAVGPHLWNVVGRDIGGVDAYAYSGVLAGMDGAWDLENLLGFLENPSGWAPGTKMGYGGLKDVEDRVNLIAYLNDAGDAPVDLAAMAPEAASTVEEQTEVVATELVEPEAAGTDLVETTEELQAETQEQLGEMTDSTPAAVEPETPQVVPPAAMEPPTEATEVPADAAPTETADAAPAAETETMAEAPAAEAAPATETAAAPAGGGEYASLLASADADNGEKVYRKCRACHKIEDGKNGVGPHLYGVNGRDIAPVDGFSYSEALSSIEGAWTLDNIMPWLENPRDFAPGNKMGFAGLKDAQDRIDVLTYINRESGGNGLTE